MTKNIIKRPAKIVTGNPTAKIFSWGAVRVIIPNARLISSRAVMTGSANKMPPAKTIDPNDTSAVNDDAEMLSEPMGIRL
jgi:hypothetical protein